MEGEVFAFPLSLPFWTVYRRQLNPQKNIPFFYPTFSLLNGTAGGRGGFKTVLAFMCCGGEIAPY